MNEPTEVSYEERRLAARQILSDNLQAFAESILEEHITSTVPDFHKEIYKLLLGGNRRIAVAAPRGHAKSTMVSLAYVLWCALTGRKKFIVLVSDTYPQCKLFMQSIKDELEHNTILKAYFGVQKTDRWAENDIELKCGVRIMGKGAEMKIRGLKYGANRPDLIVVDDLENDEMVESNERRMKLERWFRGALIPALSDDGQIVVIGTILHDDSLLTKILNKYNGWQTKIYKAIQEDGTALWPEHLSIKKLLQLKADYTQDGLLDLFMAEYMNDPITDENRVFKRKYFQYFTKDPKDLKIAITVDLAISKKDYADYTVVLVQGVDAHNERYVLDYTRARSTPYETVDTIFKMVEKYKPWCVGVETVAFQEVMSYILKDEMKKRNEFFKIVEIKSRRNKNERIIGLQPMFEAGVIHFKGHMTDLEEELLTFRPNKDSKHDDIIDALAMQQELVRNTTPNYQPNRQFDSITGY